MAVLFPIAPGAPHVFRVLVTLFGALFLFSRLQTASAQATALPPFQDDRVWFNWYRPQGDNSTEVKPSLVDAFDPVSHLISDPHTEGEKQTAKFVEYLSNLHGSKIPPPHVSLRSLESALPRRLSHRRDPRVTVNFVQMGGSNGDTAVISSLVSQMMRQSDLFKVRHAVISPNSYRSFFPDKLKKHFHHDNRRWESSNPDEYERFARKVASVMEEEPDLLVIGHSMAMRSLASRIHRDSYDRMERAVRSTSRRVTVDTSVFYQPGISERGWELDDVTPWYFRLYLQEPSLWNNPNPLSLGAPMTGKATGISGAATPGQASGEVYRWIKKQRRKIMYLGIGTRLREYDQRRITPLFEEYVDQALKAGTSWSFIVLHNWRFDDAKFPRTTHGGRVFHLFYGEAAFLDLFQHVDLVGTHGGVGSLTDAIQAGIPQMIIPVPEIAPDQEYFAERIERSMGLGVGLPPIRRDQLVGKGSRYPVHALSDAVNRAKKYYHSFADATRPYREQLEANDSVKNSMDIIVRALEGHFARKASAAKHSGMTSRLLHRMDAAHAAQRVAIASS